MMLMPTDVALGVCDVCSPMQSSEACKYARNMGTSITINSITTVIPAMIKQKLPLNITQFPCVSLLFWLPFYDPQECIVGSNLLDWIWVQIFPQPFEV